jgi:hypothetical protein
MTTKDKIVFGLYVATSVAVVAHAAVEINKTFGQTREERKFRKAAKQSNKVSKIK